MPGIDSSLFVEDVQDFLCGICLEVYEHPMKCCKNGHNFCKGCAMSLIRRTTSCPKCRRPMHQPIPNHKVQQQILQLRRHCLNGECNWEGSTADLARHLQECPWLRGRCPNDSTGCLEVMCRKDVYAHTTEFCGFSLLVCPRSQDDPLRCGYIKRKDMPAHERVCLRYACNNRAHGCLWEGPEEDVMVHEDWCNQLHFTHQRARAENEQLRQRNEHLKVQILEEQRRAASAEAQTHRLEEETHRLEEETHRLEEETHRLEEETHRLEEETHRLATGLPRTQNLFSTVRPPLPSRPKKAKAKASKIRIGRKGDSTERKTRTMDPSSAGSKSSSRSCRSRSLLIPSTASTPVKIPGVRLSQTRPITLTPITSPFPFSNATPVKSPFDLWF
ncbi:hypothetical protein BT69DRAFT_1352801 [Atractiella rhizophila]|nr:hypothetical protein BT69DRAFT_1352801 [Atractiella rhizophila]